MTRLIVWLSRWRYCRGFGIQSPWAYWFVRYVVNEHYSYYAYDEMSNKYPHLNADARRMCKLYFRMTNFRQPHTIVNVGDTPEAYKAYMQRGCLSAVIDDEITLYQNNEPIELMRMTMDENFWPIFNKTMIHVNENSILIVEGIHATRSNKRTWETIKQDDRTNITFDLYYCGIIFFDKKRYKRNYIINF